ncbi:MAG: CoA pyrophosphatase [Proteobacteria bacterium]|nr:CoA pyrophosphatase [Pseudomonadota bacterium]
MSIPLRRSQNAGDREREGLVLDYPVNPDREWVARRFSSGRPAAAAARLRGDHDLNPGTVPDPPLIPAAVLVPLVDRARGLTVLLTERTEHLADHAGQISFPGGRIEAGDVGPEDAALRETEEETGLSRQRVEVLGRLDTYITRTGFTVTPVVAIANPPLELDPDPREVAAVFEVPLAFFLDAANHRRCSRPFRGSVRQFYAMPYGDRYIWGATAGMLVNLYERLS